MNGAFRAVLERYGQVVELHCDGDETGVAVRAFIQAVSDKTNEQRLPTPLGRARQDRFLYLGDPDEGLDILGENGYVLWQGRRYGVRSTHPVYVGDAVNHWWAILEPWEEEEL